ncbi:Nitrogen permease regulator 3-like protein [Portunus trituberculatus]|uniref:GATOR complex protein NPRL3 n=1 Tax=Portunus trituberculatus TaxID=210409 RepID=A0A5B7DBG1_PORTR|nr:Nitrogen permease regulator 3-like protein [Portunus trituberculatus]
MDVDPLCIIIVKNGSRGDRLLFRYPYTDEVTLETKIKDKRPTPYSLITEESIQTPPEPHTSNISNGKLVGFHDKTLSNLFAVKSELSDSKFELKVNDVRFVGHPLRLNPALVRAPTQGKRKPSTIILVNIVFALKATINHDVVNCYHDLSKRLGIALRHEEYRCQFLSSQAKIMLAAHDEATQLPEDGQVSPFQLILDRSLLAQHLKQAYDELCGSGIVQLRLNNWIEVSFCLPQKVHRSLATGLPVDQLHTYVYLAPTLTLDTDNSRGSSREIGGTGPLGSHGTSSPASTSIPTPTVHEPPPLSQEPVSLISQPPPGHHPDITQDALHRAAVQLSHPASESDLGSVCSDERSPSPGVTLGTTPELSVHHQLDSVLSLAEKEMVMKVEAAQNPEDLKLFAKLVFTLVLY